MFKIRVRILLAIGTFLAVGILLFAGCGQREAQPTESVASFETAEELIRKAEEREQQEREKPKEELSAAAGTYQNVQEGISEEFYPTLTLYADGRAVFHANLNSAMGDISGSYTLQNKAVKIEVEKVSFDGFTGQDVTDLVFDFVDDDTLKLAYTNPDTPVGMTYPGDEFKRIS